MSVCYSEGNWNVCLFILFLVGNVLRPRSSSSHTSQTSPPSFVHEASHEWQRRTPPGILVTAPSGRGQGSPSGPQSVPTLPVWCCLMSAYEQTFDCQVALPPRHADQAGICYCCSNPGASKGGLGFPK